MNKIQLSHVPSRSLFRNNNIAQKFAGRQGDKSAHLNEACDILKQLIPNGLTNYNRGTIKNVLSICFSIIDPQSPDAQNESYSKLLSIAAELNRNTSRFFQVVFPKSAVDLGAMCYIMSEPGEAFLANGNLNIEGFNNFLSHILGNSAEAVRDNIKASYLNNIKKENGVVKYNNYQAVGEVALARSQLGHPARAPLGQPEKDPLDIALDASLAILKLGEPQPVKNYNNAFKKIKDIEMQPGRKPIADLNNFYIDRVYTAIVSKGSSVSDISDFINFLDGLPNDLKSSLENTLYTHLITSPKSFIKFYDKLAKFRSNGENLRQKVAELRNKLTLQFIDDVRKVFNIFILSIDKAGMVDLNNRPLLENITHQLEFLNEAQNEAVRLFQQRTPVQELYVGVSEILNFALIEQYDKKIDEKSQGNHELSLYDMLEAHADLGNSVILAGNHNAKIFKEFWKGQNAKLSNHCAAKLPEKLASVHEKIEQCGKIEQFQSLVDEMKWANFAVPYGFNEDVFAEFDKIKSSFREIVSHNVTKLISDVNSNSIQSSIRSFFSASDVINKKLDAIKEILDMMLIIKKGKEENTFLRYDSELATIMQKAEDCIIKALPSIKKKAPESDKARVDWLEQLNSIAIEK